MAQGAEKKQKRKKWPAILVITIAFILAAGIWLYVSHQSIAEKQVTRILSRYGIETTSLQVNQFTTSNIAASDIRLGTDPALTIGSLTIDYALNEITRGKLKHIETQDVEANIYHKNGIWQVGGLEKFTLPTASNTSGTSLATAFDAAQLRNTAPTLNLTNATLRVDTKQWQFAAPFAITFTHDPQPALSAGSKNLILNAKPYAVAANDIKLTANLDVSNHTWAGKISIPTLTLSGFPSEIPALKLNGTFSSTQEKTQASFQATDKTKTYNASISLSFPTATPAKGTVTVKRMDFPWGGGTLRITSTFPFAMKTPIPVSLTLKEVDLASLLGEASDGKIQGTGKVSGTVPITYYPNGNITLQQGVAEALSSGIISVPPSMLPGENEQLVLARSALENFHYTTLKIIVSSDKDKRSAITLALEGKNPEVLEGRPIKLNVNISGDILPLLQQSLMPFKNIKDILELEETP